MARWAHADYARRTGAERGFATAKDPGRQRHQPRLVPPRTIAAVLATFASTRLPAAASAFGLISGKPRNSACNYFRIG